MALNKNEFMVKNFTISKGSLDVNDQFVGEVYSYTKTGETSVEFTKEYAEFLDGVPSGVVRKDLTSKRMKVMAQIPQFDVEKIQDILGGKLVSDPNYEGYQRLNIGSDEECLVEYAWMLAGEIIDCVNGNREFIIMIRVGKIITETATLQASGTDHLVLPLSIEAFEDPTISDPTGNLGFILIQDVIS